MKDRRCEECGSELSACGEPGPDGIPTDDCLPCRLLENWNEERLWRERAEKRCTVLYTALAASEETVARLMREREHALLERDRERIARFRMERALAAFRETHN